MGIVEVNRDIYVPQTKEELDEELNRFLKKHGCKFRLIYSSALNTFANCANLFKDTEYVFDVYDSRCSIINNGCYELMFYDDCGIIIMVRTRGIYSGIPLEIEVYQCVEQ